MSKNDVQKNNTTKEGRKPTRAIAASIMAAVLVVAFAGVAPVQQAHADSTTTTTITSCNCVVFRLDDIQNYWLHDVQLNVLDAFIHNNTKLSTGLIMNFYGSDLPIVNKVQQGKDAGLFELALHGWNHVDYAQLSLAEQESTLADANNKLLALHNQTSNIFFAPDNSVNQNTLVAMKDDGIAILSSDLVADNGFLPTTYPPADSLTGVKSLPETVDVRDTHKPNGSNGKTEPQLLNEINNSLANHGFAVVMLHPTDYAVYDSNHVAQNVVNATQLATLTDLIAHLKSDGVTITDFNGLAASLASLPPPPDTTRPTGTIAWPAAESGVQTNTPFAVNGTASDNVGISNVEVRITNAAGSAGTPYVPALINGAGWSYNNLSTPTTDYDTIRVRITDSSGNQNWLSEHLVVTGVTPDQIAPAVAITSPADGQQIPFGSTITVTGTASDNVALSSVEVRATRPDGSGGTTYAPATVNGSSWSFDLPMVNSEYTRVVSRATDTSGNQNWAVVSAAFTSAPDNTKPEVNIFSPQANSTVFANNLVINGTAFDGQSGIAYVEFRSDGTTYQEAIPAVDDWSYWSIIVTLPSAGPTNLVAHAVDKAGNQQWVVTPVNVTTS